MAYYPDLTPYAYTDSPRGEPVGRHWGWWQNDPPPPWVALFPQLPPGEAPVALNVGWLEAPHPFPTGATPKRFRELLFALCRHRCCQKRGRHACQFCHGVPGEIWRIVPRRDAELDLGSAEIRAVGADGTVYAAPNLVYHYVTAHNYLPPAPFVEAVLSCGE